MESALEMEPNLGHKDRADLMKEKRGALGHVPVVQNHMGQERG